MIVLNLEQTFFDLRIPILSLFSFLDVITQQETVCQKWAQPEAAQKSRATYNPSDPSKRVTYI